MRGSLDCLDRLRVGLARIGVERVQACPGRAQMRRS